MPRSRFRRIRVVSILALLILGTFSLVRSARAVPVPPELHAGPMVWTELTPGGPTPSPRQEYSLVRDTARNRLLLFAGYDGAYRNDVWELPLTGAAVWTQLTPSGAPPSGRAGHSAIYDPVRDRMWVFAGSDGAQYLDDVSYLSLTGAPAWIAVTPNGTPPWTRRSHSATYVPAGDRMIVFGGYTYLNDVWALSLSGTPTWTELSVAGTPPDPRQGHLASYEPDSTRLVIVGGDNGSTWLNDVWDLDLTGTPTWIQEVTTGAPPSPRRFFAGDYDSVEKRILLFGGQGGSGIVQDAWSLSRVGTPTWDEVTPLDPPSPGPRWTLSGAFDPARRRLLVFGGTDAMGTRHGDLWSLSALPPDSSHICVDEGWQTVLPLAPPPGARFASAMVSEESRATLLLFGGKAVGFDHGDTWQWQGDRWAQQFPANNPDARFDHAMAYDRARDRVVLFGGESFGSRRGDTWEWDGTNWALVSTGGPSPRLGHVMAYDEVTQQVLLFGGDDGFYRNDTWAWNGVAWSLLTTVGPSPRAHAAAASDPLRDRVVLFGGKATVDPASGLQDTWEWDGATWTQASPSASPPARSRHVMAFSGGCGQVLVAAGEIAGSFDVTDTWKWNGTRWIADDIGLFLVSPSMAYDLASSRMIAFGGLGDGGIQDVTWSLCCKCDDEVAALDPEGNVLFPTTLDPDEPITYQDVDEEVGPTDTEFPGFETDADTWYENWPCLPAIGGEIPEGADEGALDDSLTALGISVSAQTMVDSLDVWESQILAYALAQPAVLPTAPPTGPNPPYTPPTEPYCPPASGTYVFGGRDIVFVHGLKLDHLFDRIFGVPGAQVDWVPPTTFPGRAENPEFYNDTGYYRDIALVNWETHLQRFFLSRGIRNRYVIVSYPCNARYDVGIQAILTQIGDAMRFGTNVVDLTGRSDSTKFGTPSFVIVSHSTGGPITDAALWAAQNHANLKADFIAKRCKAHVALSGAFGGSRFASAAVALSPVLTLGANELTWLCGAVNLALVSMGHATVTCPPNFAPLANSVLIDLSPRVAETMWGTALDNTNIPTVLANGGHPSLLGPLKNIFHPGFDDGVLNQNSVGANPGLSAAWPQGFIAANGLQGILQTFDKGMKQSAPRRARRFFLDQVLDPSIQQLTGPLPSYVAATEILYLSSAGMLQSVGLTFPNTFFDPLRRRNRHLSFMASTSDHFSIRSAEFYPDYKPTKNDALLEANWEEIRTIRPVDKPDFRLHYTPGPVAYGGDDQALLEAACAPPVSYARMGRYVEFKIKILGKKYVKRWWIWKRHYFRPTNSASRHICDYVYSSILACGDGIPKCDVPTTVGGDDRLSFRALGTPNPFAGVLALEFRLPRAARITIDVYDMQGRHVRAIVDETFVAGTHEVQWNGDSDSGRTMSSGTYFWKLRLDGKEKATEKILILR